MKKYTILGHLFELDDRAHHFLVRYIERIEHYAKDHGITQDVVDDIKYNIIEKLYRHESPITEKEVLEIANALGEPEVMFDEDESAQKGFNVHFDKIDLSKGKLGIIDRERPVLRGVCYRLSKSLNIEVRIIRIAFIILTLLNGVGIIIYILLALFAPYRDKKKTTGTIGNFIFEVVRIAFWVIVIAVLGPLVGATLFGTGILFFTPEVSHQSFAAWIPQYMYGTMGVVTVSLLALFIGAIGALFKQRRINKTFALLATMAVIAGSVITAGTVYKTVILVTDNTTTLQQTENFPLAKTTQTGQLILDMTTIGTSSPDQFLNKPIDTNLRFIAATGNDVRITVETQLSTVTRTGLEQAINAYVPLTITKTSPSKITFTASGDLFTQTVPFTIVRRTITVAVPVTQEIMLQTNNANIDIGRTHQYKNMRSDGRVRPIRSWGCESQIYVYDTIQQLFVCKDEIGDEYEGSY